MKFNFMLFLLIFSVSLLFGYDEINNWDKNSIKGDNLQFDGKNFYFKNEKKVIDKNSISYISLNMNENLKQKNEETGLDNITAPELLKRSDILQKKHPS